VCSVIKIVGYVRGLPLLVGLKSVSQYLPNFGSGLQIIPRRSSRGLQNNFLLVPGLVGNFRRREWSNLYDMQVAIQIKEHYISTNNLTTLYWAVIYRVLTKLTSLVKQQGGLP
jgi:hypothetical protein